MGLTANFAKSALRSMLKAGAATFISVAGMAVAFAACLLIALFILHEQSYDDFHSNADRTFRVCRQLIRPDGSGGMWASVGVPPGPLLNKEIAGIENTARIVRIRTAVRLDSEPIYENDFLYVDPSFFDIFGFEILRGNRANPLPDPHSVVLTQSTARKYFPDQPAVGNQLYLADGRTLTVSAIAEDSPDNSHIQFGIIASLENYFAKVPSFQDHWDGPVWTYLEIEDDADPAVIESSFPGFIENHLGADVSETLSYFLQPLRDIHLSDLPLGAQLHARGDIGKLYMLGGIGLLILVIACFNFVNMSTALFARRLPEVGVRKAMGATRREVALQFLTEPILIALFALGISLALAELLQPAFESISGVRTTTSSLANPRILPATVLVVVLVGIIAGLYPALLLSRLNPASIIHGRKGTLGGRSRLRTALVVIQFSASIILIVLAIVAYRQADHLRTQDLGFETDGIVVIPMSRDILRDKLEAIRIDCLQSPRIEDVSASSDIPAGNDCRGIAIESINSPDPIHLPCLFVDRNYGDFLGLDMQSGKSFSEIHSSQLDNMIVVNKKAMERLDADGAMDNSFFIVDPGGYRKPVQIAGVTENFHFRYLRMPIQPLVLRADNQHLHFLLARLDTEDIPGSLKDLKSAVTQFTPEMPYEYFFLDSYTDDLYAAEERFGWTFAYACFAAILIACMGLFGLASIVSIQRTREIGVRKTLGASTLSVALLLTRGFIFPVVIAALISWPLSYLLASRWLESYLYRISLGADIFIAAGVITLLVAALTVGVRSIKSATANPVDSLRSE